ncbi:ABC transporter permease subunit [Planctomyces sp. SH-PL14]|uniref:ABC transporter permease subunit n=1 Tax=Planctomyces sp. SH-PL14 TaxID=1632864 RepID=UPI00078D0506|nr:ABC transporter permease subunit [Planctomyces sp. SH-PL14]AMV21552.1 ABC-2 family transporter protein [Planctomyces sp. SH-PL14]
MLAGPLFSREALTAPRQPKHFLMRAGYIAALIVIMYTAGQATFERRIIQDVGDLSRFGEFVTGIFAFVQLILVTAAAILFSAGSVAQEKDRGTLILLLMTDLRDFELVYGKLLASLLIVVTLIGVSVPVFAFLMVLGGLTLQQVLWIEAISLSAAFAAGAWAILVAYWREKTFQTLAISVLGAVMFIAVVEGLAALAGPQSGLGTVLRWLDPFRALSVVLDPLAAYPTDRHPTAQALGPTLAMTGVGLLLSLWTVFRVRVWNPSRNIFIAAAETPATADEQLKTVVRPPRRIWETPILWREICTRAYGRKMILIKVAYALLAAAIWWAFARPGLEEGLILGVISYTGFAFVAVALISLLLVNAQAVTSLTNERDAQTLELLLVTEISAKEFIFGKLGGVLYNTKEAILVPCLFLAISLLQGGLTLENAIYVFVGFATLVLFVAMLGLHAGLSFHRSRTAIANSLGTVFFLFIGIFVCMMLIVEARSSFGLQLTPFLIFILGGSLGLWASLTHKSPSPALTLAAAVLPFLTFYAIASFVLDSTLGVAACVFFAYGFATFAMLVPAISEFTITIGRARVER